MDDWLESTEIKKMIPNFQSTFINQITGINYYTDYNEYFEETSILETKLKVIAGDNSYILELKFDDVSNLNICDVGSNHNKLASFRISDNKQNGYSRNARYTVEDYEEGTLELFCSTITILSVNIL